MTGYIDTLLDWQSVKNGVTPPRGLDDGSAPVFLALFSASTAAKAWLVECPTFSPINYTSNLMNYGYIFRNQRNLKTLPEIDYISNEIEWANAFRGACVEVDGVVPHISIEDGDKSIWVIGSKNQSPVTITNLFTNNDTYKTGDQYFTSAKIV